MKKIIIIGVFFALSSFVSAQFESVMAYDANVTVDDLTMVRNLSDSEVVTYNFRNHRYHRFTYENNSTLNYNFFDLPSPDFDSIRIYDFRIIGDYLFFCGRRFNANVGVLGVFKANSLKDPVGTYLQIDYLDVPGTTILNRMEVYIDPVTNNPRVAAVGYNGNGPCGAWACGVWVDCANFAPGSMTASVSVNTAFFGGMSAVEQWFDVVSTNNWVVLVGFGNIYGQQGLILRRFPKNNPMDPEIDNLYFYKEMEPVAWEEVRAVFTKENDMAVVYRGNRSYPTYDFTKFRIFDINSMQNINSQEYVIPYKSYIWEMAFLKDADRVVVLNNFPTPSFLSNFVYLIPYQQTSYTSTYLHDDSWFFRSVTDLDGKYFVGAGPFHFLLRDATASFPANNSFSGSPVLCPFDEKLNVEIIDNVEPVVFPESLSPATPPISIHSCSARTYRNSLILKCFSY